MASQLQTRFSAIPALPQTGIDVWQVRVLGALKENVELLTGARAEPDGASIAITKAKITVDPPPAQSMTQVKAAGAGAVVSGTSVPLLQDYSKLLSDVQTLANDVAALRATVEKLITQLKG